MTRDQKFFYDNAGFSIAPGETKRKAKTRCGKQMAAAEAHAKEQGWVYEWREDEDGCIGCDCDSPDCACSSGEAHETLCCILRDNEASCYDAWGNPRGGAVIASLGSICGATSEYRRVIGSRTSANPRIPISNATVG